MLPYAALLVLLLRRNQRRSRVGNVRRESARYIRAVLLARSLLLSRRREVVEDLLEAGLSD